jgi:hypothetical protein
MPNTLQQKIHLFSRSGFFQVPGTGVKTQIALVQNQVKVSVLMALWSYTTSNDLFFFA